MINKYLIGIPCLYAAKITENALNSVVNKENVDILIINNGAEPAVISVIEKFNKHYQNVTVINNSNNIYVNPAWNQILEYFLQHPDYDYVCIMNSDIIMQHQFNIVLDRNHFLSPNDIYIATQVNNIVAIKNRLNAITDKKTEVTEGTAGVNIILNRKQAEIIYPIPEYIKIWFGDNWIYEILREIGYKTYILDSLQAFHYGSQNVSKLPGISQIIEKDKKNWNFYSVYDKQKIIEKYKP